jgi:hypothetical protein
MMVKTWDKLGVAEIVLVAMQISLSIMMIEKSPTPKAM